MTKDSLPTGVLLWIYQHPYKLQSDFAREWAQQVAALASMGYISTLEEPGVYGNKWRITGIGLDKLRSLGRL